MTRRGLLMLAVGGCASLALAGLSGTYTVKPPGGGDFSSLRQAAEAVSLEGMSGDCVFLLDSADYRDDPFTLEDMADGDEFLLTLRAAAGQHVILDNEAWRVSGRWLPDVELDGIEFGSETFLLYSVRARALRVHGCTIRGKLTIQYGAGHLINGNRIAFLNMYGTERAVVANNAFMETDANLTWGALVVEDAAGLTRVCFNTFYRDSGSADVSCVWAYGDSLDIRNNVYVARYGGTDGAFCCEPGNSPPPTSDYNCYWTTPPVPAVYDYVSGVGYALADWQALGYDLHGLGADPMVTGGGDPHLLAGSPCIGAGVPIPGFEYDIDGDPRDPDHPDIGCDEYTPGGVESGREAKRVTPGLQVMPNPAGAVAQVTAVGESRVSVYDAAGRRVCTLRLSGGRARVEGQKPGVYVLRGERTGASARLVVR